MELLQGHLWLQICSSVSSVTGNANHANYAGANAALDALAEQHASQGSGVVAVQWGAWASVGTF